MTVALTARWLPELRDMPWLDELRAEHVALVGERHEALARPEAIGRRHAREDDLFRAAVREAARRPGEVPGRSSRESDEFRRAELELAGEAVRAVSERLAVFVVRAQGEVRAHVDELHAVADREPLAWPGLSAGPQQRWLQEGRDAAQLLHGVRRASQLVPETAHALGVNNDDLAALAAA